MSKSVLITGGAGFIGINTANYYLQKDYDVTILDNFSRKGSKGNVEWLLEFSQKKPRIIEADVVSDRKVINRLAKNSDIVFHFAAQVAVTTSVKDPVQDFNINALGTLHVLEALRNSNNDPILIFSSTNKVYGDLQGAKVEEKKTRYELKDFPYGISEDYPMHFKSPYGCSKGTGDQYVHDYHTIYGLKTIVFRQSCIYGPHQFGIEDQGWIAWFIIAQLLGKEITIYGDGKQVRDLLYINDLIEAYDLSIKHINKTKGQIYNMGGGINNTISVWTELKPILEDLFGTKVSVKKAKERPGDQKFFCADIRKAKRDFNWEPKIGIKEGIPLLYNWVKENKSSVQKYFK